MRKAARNTGYTLIETIVGLLIFTVGALALAASSSLVLRAMTTNVLRERAARAAAARIEIIKSQCASATGGRETVDQIDSRWVVEAGSSTISVVEVVGYASADGWRSTATRSAIWCPR
ncbi:MAG: prepilin-type N-terminal cleavage/methylation domain-containing protein [Gemmatimonadaceae bacterium]